MSIEYFLSARLSKKKLAESSLSEIKSKVRRHKIIFWKTQNHLFGRCKMTSDRRIIIFGIRK